jgi:hypothetical protein
MEDRIEKFKEGLSIIKARIGGEYINGNTIPEIVDQLKGATSIGSPATSPNSQVCPIDIAEITRVRTSTRNQSTQIPGLMDLMDLMSQHGREIRGFTSAKNMR